MSTCCAWHAARAPSRGPRRERTRQPAATRRGGRADSAIDRRDRAGLIGSRQFALMQQGTLLVNAARGPIVATDALVEALHSGRIRAAIDVTDPEPLAGRASALELSKLADHAAHRRIEHAVCAARSADRSGRTAPLHEGRAACKMWCRRRFKPRPARAAIRAVRVRPARRGPRKAEPSISNLCRDTRQCR